MPSIRQGGTTLRPHRSFTIDSPIVSFLYLADPWELSKRRSHVKPILILMAVVLTIGLAIPAGASGQSVSQTKELRLTPEQMGEEIEAWQKQLAALEDDIRDPTKIWVKLEQGYEVSLEEEEVVGQIKRLWLFEFFFKSVANAELGFERAMWTEQRVIAEMDAAVKATYNELMKQDRAIREEKEQQARRLREIIEGLEWKRLSAMRARSQAAGTPAFKPDEATVTDSEKAAVKNALEPVRLREQWDLRDHGYVLNYLDRRVKTPSQLRSVKKLIADISACYQAWHAENARIAEAARAGNWMPGKRIEAGDKANRAREARLKEIKATFEEDWQSP